MSETLRLADELQRVAKWSDSEHWDTLAQAAAELRRLHEAHALVAAHTREECAKVCEEEGLLWGQRYADAIRSRT